MLLKVPIYRERTGDDSCLGEIAQFVQPAGLQHMRKGNKDTIVIHNYSRQEFLEVVKVAMDLCGTKLCIFTVDA